jgi:hypothetical protein
VSSSSPQNNFEEGKDALGGSFFYRSKIERTYPNGKQEKPACSPEKEKNRKAGDMGPGHGYSSRPSFGRFRAGRYLHHDSRIKL